MDPRIAEHLVFNNIISFDVYPVSVLGARFQNVKVLAPSIDAGSVRSYVDPVSMHQSVYPQLPPGVPDDPYQYPFVKLRHPNGTISVIGVPYIRPETLTTDQRGRLTITIEDARPEDHTQVMRALASIGLQAAKVTLT